MTISTYWKVPFEWRSTTSPQDNSQPTGWSWTNGTDPTQPVELVAHILANSPGPEDHYAAATLGAEAAARETLMLAAGFSYLPQRWHVLNIRSSPAGFVLPVIYDGCARDGLDEATIYHMGVAPIHRGAGLGRLLLRHATRVLVEHGVWRIFGDTPETNEPMIYLFEDEGWKRLPRHERPVAL